MIAFTPAGRLAQLRRLARAGVTLGLYTNADAPDVFREPVVGEYAPIPLEAGDWQIDTGAETASLAERGWTFTSDIPQVVGWFARGEGGQVEFWEPFAQPIHINQIGDQIKVAITISPV
jgi:hypothetical protein